MREPAGDKQLWRRIITEHDQAMAQAVGRAMDKSAKLLQDAAKAGDGEAQFALALLYLLGRGVKQNSAEACRLFALAADAGDEQAASFRDKAAEELAREQVKKQELNDAAVLVLKDAKRRQCYPKPRLVRPD